MISDAEMQELLATFTFEGEPWPHWVGEIPSKFWQEVYNEWAGLAPPGSRDFIDTTIDTQDNQPPALEQVAALRYWLDHERAVRDGILQGIFAEYPRLLEEQELDEDEQEGMLLKIPDANGLKRLITLSAIWIHRLGWATEYWQRESQEGMAVIDLCFDTAWDRDHNLDVLVHKDRVLRVTM